MYILIKLVQGYYVQRLLRGITAWGILQYKMRSIQCVVVDRIWMCPFRVQCNFVPHPSKSIFKSVSFLRDIAKTDSVIKTLHQEESHMAELVDISEPRSKRLKRSVQNNVCIFCGAEYTTAKSKTIHSYFVHNLWEVNGCLKIMCSLKQQQWVMWVIFLQLIISTMTTAVKAIPCNNWVNNGKPWNRIFGISYK